MLSILDTKPPHEKWGEPSVATNTYEHTSWINSEGLAAAISRLVVNPELGGLAVAEAAAAFSTTCAKKVRASVVVMDRTDRFLKTDPG
jgi:hypothetical protein